MASVAHRFESGRGALFDSAEGAVGADILDKIPDFNHAIVKAIIANRAIIQEAFSEIDVLNGHARSL